MNRSPRSDRPGDQESPANREDLRGSDGDGGNRTRATFPPSKARRPAPRFLFRRARQLPDADSPETRVEAERVAEAIARVDEPEMIGPGILSTYGEDALYFQSLRRLAVIEAARQARPQLAAEDRLRDCRRRAKAQHVDVSHELHALAAMLEQARRGGRRPSASALARLERLEARLDRVPDLAATS